jgi:hypothetical protein
MRLLGDEAGENDSVDEPLAVATGADVEAAAALVAGATSPVGSASVRLSPPHEAASEASTPQEEDRKRPPRNHRRTTIGTECEESVSRDDTRTCRTSSPSSATPGA